MKLEIILACILLRSKLKIKFWEIKLFGWEKILIIYTKKYKTLNLCKCKNKTKFNVKFAKKNLELMPFNTYIVGILAGIFINFSYY